MSRLINADVYCEKMRERQKAVCDLIAESKTDSEREHWNGIYMTFVEAKLIMDNMPTVDAVEVVRCKDCIFWGDKDGIQYNEHIEKRCARCRAHNYEFNGQHWGWCPTEDDYCSFGEKKVSE